MNTVLAPYAKGPLKLKNHLVMAPMTRSRAIGNLPNALMAEYYSQRTGAGMIITEGTSPSPEGLGYARIPGIFSAAQVEGWKLATAGVKAGNSTFFLQLMHTGRIGHTDNLPEGTQLAGPSGIRAAGQIWTDRSGMQDFSEPLALTTAGVKAIIAGHVQAAKNAVAAGFDGVELHGANGYLIEQFLNPGVNTRTDEYGGTIENRARIAVDMASAIAAAIGPEKIGIRFSPFNTFGDQPSYPEAEVQETYRYLAQEMERIGIAYVHVAVTPKIPRATLEAIRQAFTGTIIRCNAMTPETAEAALTDGFADVVAFGKPFLANPDLDLRIATNQLLNAADASTFYTADAKGYTDYPTLAMATL
jgi:N-ethylmaleimide reductase